MPEFNAANVEKVIAYVKTRDWHTDSYSDTTQCMAGIIAKALNIPSTWEGSYGPEVIQDSFGIGYWNARSMYGLRSRNDNTGEEKGHGFAEFNKLSTKEQNDVLVGMLEHLRDTQGVDVDFMGIPEPAL